MITSADILRNHCLWQRSWTKNTTSKPLPLQSRTYNGSGRSSASSTDGPGYRHQIPDPLKTPRNQPTPASLKSRDSDLPVYSTPSLNRQWKSVPAHLGERPTVDPESYTYDGTGPPCIHRVLEDRRQQRVNRRRPWTEKVTFAPANRRNRQFEFFYEGSLPADVDPADLKRRTRKYVANIKYGNIYELRHRDDSGPVSERTGRAWIWERDFELWLSEKDSKVPSRGSNRDNELSGSWSWDLSRTAPQTSKVTSQQPKVAEQQSKVKDQTSEVRDQPSKISNAPPKTAAPKTNKNFTQTQTTLARSGRSTPMSRTVTPSTTPRSTSRRATKRTPRDKLRTSKEDKPHADLFAHYNSYRLERQKKRDSAVAIQKHFRGFLIRKHLEKLKRKARLEHFSSWNKFIQEYRELVKRIQERYGIQKPVCGIDLKELEAFMNNKRKYESAFYHLAYGDKLLKEDLPEFFHDCGLFPTEGEIARAFNSVFKGNGNSAEVVFMLDCSTSTGPLSFYHLTNFVKDVVTSLEISPNRVRVGVIPYSDDVFQPFGITEYQMKHEIHRAIDGIRHKEGLTRTDLALRKMKSYLMASRPGVQRLGIVITDGKSSEPQKTVHAAKEAHNDNIEIIAIGVGRRVDMEELRAIATSEKHVLTACDYGALSSLRTTLAQKTCLDNLYTNSSNLKAKCRPLLKQEAMEILWTVYPPSACNLPKARSRWIRPIVHGTEAWALLDQNIIRATDSRTCLRMVIQARIEREGHVTLPSDVREGVERVSNCDEAMEIVERWLRRKEEEGETGNERGGE